jgi:choline monooxygenase
MVESYDPHLPLAKASTPPASWYIDPRIASLERRAVFANSWQMVGRRSQVSEPGQYLTWDPAAEPVMVVRGNDAVLRGFFNVCRHHAAAVMTEPEGRARDLCWPYHGWTYTLEGKLHGVPDRAGLADFDRSANGLIPVETALWGNWVFVKLEQGGPALADFLGAELGARVAGLGLEHLHWMERRRYTLDCNWKVFVDNYLDGGYHVPHLHRGLNSVLQPGRYQIENGERFCVQSSPLTAAGAEAQTRAVRSGERALYCWIYPNLMINWYEGVMDTNLVCPRAVDRTEVIFDFYFADISAAARERNLASIAVSERIQHEDTAICNSVQRGLKSSAYRAGRLVPRREAGEHLFHRLLHADLKAGLVRVAGSSGN